MIYLEAMWLVLALLCLFRLTGLVCRGLVSPIPCNNYIDQYPPHSHKDSHSNASSSTGATSPASATLRTALSIGSYLFFIPATLAASSRAASSTSPYRVDDAIYCTRYKIIEERK